VALQGSLCLISGLVRATRGMRNPITTLPPICRPNKRLIFNLNNHENTIRVDVLPNGQVRKVAGRWKYGWLSLSGIVIATKGRKRLALQNKWKNYGGSYGSITYTRSKGGICEVEGLARGTKFGQPFATLPKSCRPKKRLIFNLNNHQLTARVDVLRNGRIVWVAGGKSHGWLSLSGIVFDSNKGRAVRTLNGWRNYGGSYGGITVTKASNMCFLSGLLRGTRWGKAMAQLPSYCRPRSRLIFNVNNNGKTARVDVLKNGQVVWIAGGRSHKWLSLTGINFAR